MQLQRNDHVFGSIKPIPVHWLVASERHLQSLQTLATTDDCMSHKTHTRVVSMATNASIG